MEKSKFVIFQLSRKCLFTESQYIELFLQLNISLSCQSIHNNKNYESHFIIPVVNPTDPKIEFYENQHFHQSIMLKKLDVNIIERLEIRLYRSDNNEENINEFDFEFLLEFSE